MRGSHAAEHGHPEYLNKIEAGPGVFIPHPKALRAHNAAVRQRNAVQNARARHAVHEMLRGNFAALDEMMGIPPKKPGA